MTIRYLSSWSHNGWLKDPGGGIRCNLAITPHPRILRSTTTNSVWQIRYPSPLRMLSLWLILTKIPLHLSLRKGENPPVGYAGRGSLLHCLWEFRLGIKGIGILFSKDGNDCSPDILDTVTSVKVPKLKVHNPLSWKPPDNTVYTSCWCVCGFFFPAV